MFCSLLTRSTTLVRLPRETTSEPPKVVRTPSVFNILTSNCASRHNGVHFFDISTSKSGPKLVFCTFWLGNVLRATTACTFSTSQLPKVVRHWGVLRILTSKCASRHNGVQFFISPLASWLRTRRFSEPTFRPSGATNHWKNTVNRDFPTFSRICIFFLLTLFLLLFFLLICLSLLSASSLLCFSSLHIVGSLTSKLPSIIYVYIQAVTQYSGQGTRTKTWHKVQEEGKWRTVMQYCLSLSRKKKPPQNSERSPTSTVPALYRNSLYKKIRGWICFPRRCVVACIWKWKSNKWGTLASSSLRNLDVCE